MPTLLFTPKKKKRPKQPKPKSPIGPTSKKTYWSVMIMRITPWFDGKWLSKSIYDVSVIQNWDETLVCVKFYTLERFSSIQLNLVFLLMLFRKKCKSILISFLVLRILSLRFHSSSLHFWKKCVLFWLVWGFDFFTKRVRI